MDVGEMYHLCIRFDPLYRDDLYNRVAEEVLTLRYLEHPHVDHVTLRGEVHFPNLNFQMMHLDFGCILNDTEVVRDITMTNCSPLLVKYRWSFLTNDNEVQIRYEQQHSWGGGICGALPTTPFCTHGPSGIASGFRKERAMCWVDLASHVASIVHSSTHCSGTSFLPIIF